MVNRIVPSPHKDVYIRIPGACDVILSSKGKLQLHLELKLLTRRYIILDYPGGHSVIQESLKWEERAKRRVREVNVMVETWEECCVRRASPTVAIFEYRERRWWTKGCWWPLEFGIGRERILPYSFQKGMQPWLPWV